MDAKMKECFKPHVLMHSLLGLGLGLIVASLMPTLAVWWYGLVLIVVAVVIETIKQIDAQLTARDYEQL